MSPPEAYPARQPQGAAVLALRLDTATPDEWESRFTNRLGPRERMAFAAIRHPRRRREWLCGRLAAKRLVARLETERSSDVTNVRTDNSDPAALWSSGLGLGGAMVDPGNTDRARLSGLGSAGRPPPRQGDIPPDLDGYQGPELSGAWRDLPAVPGPHRLALLTRRSLDEAPAGDLSRIEVLAPPRGGSPVVVAGAGDVPPFLSITHAAGWVIAAAHPARRVGVDVVDGTDAFPPAFRRGSFTLTERAWAAAAIDSHAPLSLLWAAKEAVYKAMPDRVRPHGGPAALTLHPGVPARRLADTRNAMTGFRHLPFLHPSPPHHAAFLWLGTAALVLAVNPDAQPKPPDAATDPLHWNDRT